MPGADSMRMAAQMPCQVPQERERTERRNAEARDGSKPRIKVIWNDVPGCIERHYSKGENPGRVRTGDDKPKEYSMSGGTARPH